MGSQYVYPPDLLLYATNPEAIKTVPLTTQTAACVAASEIADSYLRGRYPLPLLTWGADIKMRVAAIAYYLIRKQLGYSPEAGADQNVRDAYYEAVGYPDQPGTGWFPAVQRQSIHPDITFTQPAAPTYQFPAVITGCRRGW